MLLVYLGAPLVVDLGEESSFRVCCCIVFSVDVLGLSCPTFAVTGWGWNKAVFADALKEVLVWEDNTNLVLTAVRHTGTAVDAQEALAVATPSIRRGSKAICTGALGGPNRVFAVLLELRSLDWTGGLSVTTAEDTPLLIETQATRARAGSPGLVRDWRVEAYTASDTVTIWSRVTICAGIDLLNVAVLAPPGADDREMLDYSRPFVEIVNVQNKLVSVGHRGKRNARSVGSAVDHVFAAGANSASF